MRTSVFQEVGNFAAKPDGIFQMKEMISMSVLPVDNCATVRHGGRDPALTLNPVAVLAREHQRGTINPVKDHIPPIIEDVIEEHSFERVHVLRGEVFGECVGIAKRRGAVAVIEIEDVRINGKAVGRSNLGVHRDHPFCRRGERARLDPFLLGPVSVALD